MALALRAAAMLRWDGVRPAAVDAFEYCSGGKDEVRASEDVGDAHLMRGDNRLMRVGNQLMRGAISIRRRRILKWAGRLSVRDCVLGVLWLWQVSVVEIVTWLHTGRVRDKARLRRQAEAREKVAQKAEAERRRTARAQAKESALLQALVSPRHLAAIKQASADSTLTQL